MKDIGVFRVNVGQVLSLCKFYPQNRFFFVRLYSALIL
jgi:hypothetical protein